MDERAHQDRSEPDPTLRLVRKVASVRVALIGTYPPRQCGIATFTRDLAAAIEGSQEGIVPTALAVTDQEGRYDYTPDVCYEIRQATKGDYARAAEFLNYSDVRLALIQHEYGIFGGDDGSYVLDLLSGLQIPALVTLHTVLKSPSANQRFIVRKMAEWSAGLVVMSQTAADLLTDVHDIPRDKIHIIMHGIPDMPPKSRDVLKSAFGVSDRKMLLTFGLLGPNKGIETVIRALPQLVKRFPELVYFVVGATHPGVIRSHGEGYRTMLRREALQLGVAQHVVFRDQFVTADELDSYLQAADIFITPYLNEAQVTSGALSYAMGAGTAAVSTPYWHARELLAEGRGRLFPFGDSEGLADVLGQLLVDANDLARLRHAAFAYTRAMTWPCVGKAYMELGRAVMVPERTRSAVRSRGLLATTLPELRLDHMRRLTDDTGILQHATFTIPARQSGYCVDDNARALIVALTVQRLQSSPEADDLVSTYLAYLHHAQNDEGHFENFLTYDRRFEVTAASEDCTGRAFWALGTAARFAQVEGHRSLARQMFERALAGLRPMGPRGTATTMLGLCAFVYAHPEVSVAREALVALGQSLLDRYEKEATENWSWFEPSLSYDNALVPLALFRTFSITKNRAVLRVARASLDFLEALSFKHDHLRLIGNDGWHSRGGTCAEADEQPTDAAALVLAFRGAHLATGDQHYLRRMREAFAWFLGANRLRAPLYDFATAGCADGLGVTEVNQNQGAESTLAYLAAVLEMMDLADEDLAPPHPPAKSAN
ncbi:MAG TPA: glycosyltransferase family 4 protein [Polyangia bacterium]